MVFSDERLFARPAVERLIWVQSNYILCELELQGRDAVLGFPFRDLKCIW